MKELASKLAPTGMGGSEGYPALVFGGFANGRSQTFYLPGFFEVGARRRVAGAGLDQPVYLQGFQFVVPQLMPARRAERGVAG